MKVCQLYDHDHGQYLLDDLCDYFFYLYPFAFFDSMNIFEWINDTSERQAAYHLNATSKVQQN